MNLSKALQKLIAEVEEEKQEILYSVKRARQTLEKLKCSEYASDIVIWKGLLTVAIFLISLCLS